LSDSLHESAKRLGEVVIEAHLALEVAEHARDDEADAGLGDLEGWALTDLVLVRGDERDVDQAHGAFVFGAPEAAVGEHDAAGLRARELPGAVAFLAGLGTDEVITDRRALDVGHQDEAHAPHEQALGRAVAVTCVPAELALAGAAGVVGTRDQRPVDQPDRALGDQLGDLQLHGGDRWRQAPEPAVVLRLVGQVWKPAGQQPVDDAQELAIRAAPGRRLGDRERDQLVVGDQALGAGPRDKDRCGEHVGCDNEGLQRSGHLVLQSRAGRAGGPLLYVNAAPCPAAQPTSSL
jgi:hypothetical protein